jgi:streptomycin 6-kinase
VDDEQGRPGKGITMTCMEYSDTRFHDRPVNPVVPGVPPIPIPAAVAARVERYDSGREWLDALPCLLRSLADEWHLVLGAPFGTGSCSWTAPVTPEGGGRAVLKVSWPHEEARGEAEALRIWNGRGAVHLLRHCPRRWALLEECCLPGRRLSEGPGDGLTRLCRGLDTLCELWTISPPAPCGVATLQEVTAGWADLVEERMGRFRPDLDPDLRADPGLVAFGVDLLRNLPAGAGRTRLLHGDANPGNILSARRPGWSEPGWLMIDPKPMSGDPAYDLWPLIEQTGDPLGPDDPGHGLARRLAVAAERVGEPVSRLAAWAIARQVEKALWSVEYGDGQGAHAALHTAGILARWVG